MRVRIDFQKFLERVNKSNFTIDYVAYINQFEDRIIEVSDEAIYLDLFNDSVRNFNGFALLDSELIKIDGIEVGDTIIFQGKYDRYKCKAVVTELRPYDRLAIVFPKLNIHTICSKKDVYEVIKPCNINI